MHGDWARGCVHGGQTSAPYVAGSYCGSSSTNGARAATRPTAQAALYRLGSGSLPLRPAPRPPLTPPPFEGSGKVGGSWRLARCYAPSPVPDGAASSLKNIPPSIVRMLQQLYTPLQGGHSSPARSTGNTSGGKREAARLTLPGRPPPDFEENGRAMTSGFQITSMILPSY